MLGLAAALYTVIRYQITVDISKIMCIYFAKLACGSCTFSILHNWKETLNTGWPVLTDTATLFKQPCFLGSVMQIVMMIHINITVQIPLPPWRKEKEKKIYL